MQVGEREGFMDQAWNVISIHVLLSMEIIHSHWEIMWPLGAWGNVFQLCVQKKEKIYLGE